MAATHNHREEIQLIKPHGGEIVNREASDDSAASLLGAAAKSPRISVTGRILCDVECIATGAFSPLQGFMGRADYESCMESMRLSDGVLWPIPIVLPVDPAEAKSLKLGAPAMLVDAEGRNIAAIEVEDIYQSDHENEAQLVYGTKDSKHPGVAAILELPHTYVGGKIALLNMPTPEFPAYALTPAATRKRFKALGWRSVVGFQTRNPVHRAHEYLQKVALEIVDGLLLHPLVGTTKDDDLPAAVRMQCYEALIERYYPAGRAMLSVYPAAMRYAGPREAVLHAIVRKNYGCSHFIVGRDHAGAGSYYGPFDAQRIFNNLQNELGMTILRFDNAFWCNACEGMGTEKTCPHPPGEHVVLSGTKVRELLRSGKRPPKEISRPEIADILIRALGSKPTAV